MPKWVGLAYTRLWHQYPRNCFSFADAKEALSGKPALNLLSELKRYQALFICGRAGRNRIYRLVPPSLLVGALANKIDLRWLKQGYYANVLLELTLALVSQHRLHLQSIGLYGSLARNTANSASDLDLLVLSTDLPDGISPRLQRFLPVQNLPEIQAELRFLASKGIYPRLSVRPLKFAELEASPFAIDITFDLKILFDSGPLQVFTQRVKDLAQTRHIERKVLAKNKYYLDFHIPFGEELSF